MINEENIDEIVENMEEKTLEVSSVNTSEYSTLEPCEDAISREEVIYRIKVLKRYQRDMDDVLEMVDNLPSVRPARLRGKWITAEAETRNLVRYVCSSCDEYWDITGNIFPYCPNCGSYNGADMRGSEGE